jgi:hypothetical protein
VRRALVVLAALIFGAIITAPVEARVAVVANVDRNFLEGSFSQLDYVTSILDRFGVDYDVVPPRMAKTEFCRTGKFNTAHPGGVAASVKSYVAVIHCSILDITPNASVGYEPDSLTLTVKLPLVPQIFIGSHTSGTSWWFRTTTAESSGVNLVGGAYDGSDADTWGYSAYLVGSPLRWKWSGYGRAIVDTGTVTASSVYSFQVVPGGFRPLVAASMTPANDQVCHDCDSIYTEISGRGGAVNRPATIDTLLVWARQNLHVLGAVGYESGAAQNIFVVPAGAIGAFDPSLVVMALAYADSLTGRQIFTNTRKVPLKAAIHIDDGWRRTADPTISGGTAPSDTIFLKQSIDSLASLQVPFVVGVGVDSMPQFANQDSTWWERARPYVHYVPHVHGGTGAIGVGIGGIYDMYAGAHAFYRGEDCDNSTVAASLYCLAKRGFFHLEQRFRGRVDHVIMPPFDDWTPSTVTFTNTGPGLDSLFWVWNRAGAGGVRTNHRNRPAVMGVAGALNGYQTNPQTYRVCLPSGEACPEIGRFKIHLTSGYMSTGHSVWFRWFDQVSAFVRGFFGDESREWDTSFVQAGHRTIMACHVTDLAGSPNNNVVRRPAWWQIKYSVNRIKAANKLAGRTICEIVTPDNLRDP